MTTSDKIDGIVTNRFLGLPIFFLVMALVYYVSVSTVGEMCIRDRKCGIFIAKKKCAWKGFAGTGDILRKKPEE